MAGLFVHCGQWTVDSGQWTVDSGQWRVDWTVDIGQLTVDSGLDLTGQWTGLDWTVSFSYWWMVLISLR